MDQCRLNEIIVLITTHLFNDCNEIGIANIAQIHKIINVLAKSNIPFVMNFHQGTAHTAASVRFVITFSPTISMTKFFNLEEGFTGGRSLVNLF